jgi:hypothetical protein
MRRIEFAEQRRREAERRILTLIGELTAVAREAVR